MKYKLFGKSGLRVSELCLGTMTFGTESHVGADYETSKKVFDTYCEAGGNFLDTANRYTDGTSEKWLGEFISSDRDHFVLATKYTLFDRKNDPSFSGNNRKNMFRSVEESLKRLKTDFIDLLWVHAWDFTTPEEEVLRGLDDLIRQGKVHYIGISDTPAFKISKMNTMAELKGWTSFVGLQIEWSLICRTVERELIPMANDYQMAITPWAALAGGALTGKYLEGKDGRVPENSIRRSDRSVNITKVVVEIAKSLDIPAAQVALSWLKQQGQNVIPIIGARRAEQLKESLGCVNVILNRDDLEKLENISKLELEFPYSFYKTANDNIFGGTEDKIIK
jgi:aryl-alcohol dehydrogenase-like predicted oxidoreductase